MHSQCSGNSDFEIALKRIIKEDIEKNKSQQPARHFEKVLETLETKRGKRRLKNAARKFLIACSIIMFLSTSLYLLFPERVSEGKKRLVNSVTYIFAGGFHIETSNSLYPYFSHHDEGIIRKIMGIKDAAPFQILYPVYVPPEFKVTDITVSDEGASFSLTLLFKSSTQEFLLIQREVPEAGGAELGDGPVKEVSISGNQGILVRHRDGRSTLSFLDERGIHYMLKGNLEEMEMLQVASSLY